MQREIMTQILVRPFGYHVNDCVFDCDSLDKIDLM